MLFYRPVVVCAYQESVMVLPLVVVVVNNHANVK